MNLRSQTFFAGVGSLLLGLPAPFLHLNASAQVVAPSVLPERQPKQLSAEQLRQLAESITVKVLAGQGWGSGILIQKQGQIYTVLTNNHVLIPGRSSSYQIQTPDGQIYPANLIGTSGFDDNDLGLISFRATAAYTVASIGASLPLAAGDEVFAAGFPFDPELSVPKEFLFTIGKISSVINKAFAGGYQIGYTNAVEKGMSGGPLLNRQGQVVGINGIHAYPLWGNPYVFRDGSVASQAMQEQMSQLSWAIPIQTFVHLAAGFSSPREMPTANTLASPPRQQSSDTKPLPSSEQPPIRENIRPQNSRQELLW